MKKDNKVSDTTVTHNEGVVVAVGPQSTDKEYPITVRSSDGEYFKVWHDASLRRGTSVTIDEVIWANGWKDTFLVTC
jgi:co-chaperonin GroES (HSP10)